MNKRFEQAPRVSASSVTTLSILVVILAMVLSVVPDVKFDPANGSTASVHVQSRPVA